MLGEDWFLLQQHPQEELPQQFSDGVIKCRQQGHSLSQFLQGEGCISGKECEKYLVICFSC